MPLRTGFCQSRDHKRCLFLITNGSKARTRYIICSCDCHYGEDSHSSSILIDKLANWGVPSPDGDTYDLLSRYIDAINVIAAPKYEDSLED